MNRIVTTSLLIAAGIAISACKVTTSNITQFHNSNDDEQPVAVASVSLTTAPASATSESAGAVSSSSVGASAGGGSRSAAASSGGDGGSQSSQATGGTGQPDGNREDSLSSANSRAGNTHNGQSAKDGTVATPDTTAAAEQASREATHNGQPDKDGAASTADATAAAEAASRETRDADGNLDKDA